MMMMQTGFGGYDPKIFLKPVNQDFYCPICSCKYLINPQRW